MTHKVPSNSVTILLFRNYGSFSKMMRIGPQIPFRGLSQFQLLPCLPPPNPQPLPLLDSVARVGAPATLEASDYGIPGNGVPWQLASPGTHPLLKTMPLYRLSLLFLAWLCTSWAQLKRQRVGELEPALGGTPGSGCSFGGGAKGDGGGGTEEPFVLLPWALLLALAGSLGIYLLFAKEPGAGTGRGWRLAPVASWLKDRSLLSLFGDAPEAEEAGMDPDARLEEMLLRDVSGVLHIIRLRLWKIVHDRRKHQQLLLTNSR